MSLWFYRLWFCSPDSIVVIDCPHVSHVLELDADLPWQIQSMRCSVRIHALTGYGSVSSYTSMAISVHSSFALNAVRFALSVNRRACIDAWPGPGRTGGEALGALAERLHAA